MNWKPVLRLALVVITSAAGTVGLQNPVPAVKSMTVGTTMDKQALTDVIAEIRKLPPPEIKFTVRQRASEILEAKPD